MKNVMKMRLETMNDNQFAMFCAATSMAMIAAAFLGRSMMVLAGGHGFDASAVLVYSLGVSVPLAVLAVLGFGLKRFAERNGKMKEEMHRAA